LVLAFADPGGSARNFTLVSMSVLQGDSSTTSSNLPGWRSSQVARPENPFSGTASGETIAAAA